MAEKRVEWRTIPSFPEYEASSLGEVRRIDGNKRPLSPHYYSGNRNGRVMVRKSGKQSLVRINLLVAEAFYGPMPKEYEIIYRNGDERDNSISNIFYGNLPYFLAEPYLKEGWKWITGYEGLYIVSPEGEIRSIGRRAGPRIIQSTTLIPHEVRNYLVVGLQKNGKIKNVLVHRIVAQAFVDNPKKLPCINHKDEDKFNNRADNLEWCTYAYNNSYGTRLQRIAEKNGSPVEIYAKNGELLGRYKSYSEAGRKLGCLGQTIGRYARGERRSKGYIVKRIEE